MNRFLADENISPVTIEYLRHLSFDVKSVKEAGLRGALDEEIFRFATLDKRIIITFDLDFGEIYYFSSHDPAGVIILRLQSQWYEAANAALEKLLRSGKLRTEEFKNALIIVTEDKYRIRKK